MISIGNLGGGGVGNYRMSAQQHGMGNPFNPHPIPGLYDLAFSIWFCSLCIFMLIKANVY